MNATTPYEMEHIEVEVTPKQFLAIQDLCDRHSMKMIGIFELVESVRALGLPVDDMLFKVSDLKVNWNG